MTLSHAEIVLPSIEVGEVSPEDLAVEKSKLESATVLRDEWYAKVVHLLDRETEGKTQAEGLRKMIDERTPAVREMRANYEAEIRTNQTACDVIALAQQLRSREDELALLNTTLGNLVDTLLGQYRLDILEAEMNLSNVEASLASHEATVADWESKISVATSFPGQRIGFVSALVEGLKAKAAGAYQLAENAERSYNDGRLTFNKAQEALLGRSFQALARLK